MANPRYNFLNRYFFAVLASAIIAVVLAYQFRLPFSLDVGGPIDGPLLISFNAPEFDQAANLHFRWTTGESELYLRNWGAGNPVELRLHATRFKPPNEISDLSIYVNGLELAQPEASGQGWQEYTLPITDPKYLASDDLLVRLESDTFIPKGTVPGSSDPRLLGIQISSIQLIPLPSQGTGWSFADDLVWRAANLPPLGLALYFISSALLVYFCLVLFRIPHLVSFIGSLVFSVGAAIGLVLERPYLSLFADTFFLTLVAAIFFGLAARYLTPRFFAWGGIRASDLDINLLSLTLSLAFLVKMGMLLYPQTISFDLIHHVHRLTAVMQGTLFWSVPSTKNEFGGYPVPYPPTFYLFLAPLSSLVPLQLLVQLSGVLLDSVSILFVYFLISKYFSRADKPDPAHASPQEEDHFAGRAGLFAAWIYVISPIAFIALSWGIYPNIFGQFLTLVLIVALVEVCDKLTRPFPFIVVGLLFALTLLSHMSVFASIVPLFAFWVAILFFFGGMWRARTFWALVGAIVVACVVAFSTYYSEFLGLVAEGTMQIAGEASDPATRNVSGQTVSWLQLLQPARTQYVGVPLYIYAAALLGLALLVLLARRAPTRGRFLLVTMLVAWFAAFLLLIFVRAEFGFSSRYVNFVMPAISLCAGAGLAWVYARGLAGRAVSIGLVLLLTLQGLYHWYVLAVYQYH